MTAEQGKKGEGPKLEDEAPDDDDAPPSDVRRATTVTDEELRAFLVLPDTQAQIRKVVLARIRGKVSDVEVEDLVQEASVAVLTSTSRPKSMTTAMGWLGLVTARAVFDHFRRNKSRRQSLVLEDILPHRGADGRGLEGPIASDVLGGPLPLPELGDDRSLEPRADHDLEEGRNVDHGLGWRPPIGSPTFRGNLREGLVARETDERHEAGIDLRFLKNVPLARRERPAIR